MTNATRERIAAEARQAEQQMADIQQGKVVDIPPAPQLVAEPDPVADPVDPTPVDNRFGTGTPVDPAADPGSGPITAEQFAALQQQMQSLQGRFEHTQQQLSEAQVRASTLERLVALKSAADDTPQAPAPRQKRQIADAKLIAEYGEELVGLMRSVTQEELEYTVMPLVDQVQALAARVGQLTEGVQVTQQHVARDSQSRFNTEMDRLVTDAKGEPDWQRINTMHNAPTYDRRFVDWLAKPSEDSYEPRQKSLDRYYNDGNAQACARFFNKFKAEVGLPDGTATHDSAAQPPSVAAALVSPSPAAPGTPSTRSRGPQGRTYTSLEMERHYDDKTKGKWAGREAEWKKIAADIDKAVMEGRFIEERKR